MCSTMGSWWVSVPLCFHTTIIHTGIPESNHASFPRWVSQTAGERIASSARRNQVRYSSLFGFKNVITWSTGVSNGPTGDSQLRILVLHEFGWWNCSVNVGWCPKVREYTIWSRGKVTIGRQSSLPPFGSSIFACCLVLVLFTKLN